MYIFFTYCFFIPLMCGHVIRGLSMLFHPLPLQCLLTRGPGTSRPLSPARPVSG